MNAVKYGQEFALALLQGDEEKLFRLDSSFNKKKFEVDNGPLRQVTSSEINELRDKSIHVSLTAPLIREHQNDMIQLFSLQRNKSFIVMTFIVLNSNGTFLEIPKVGPMVAVVSLRHRIDLKSERDYWTPIFYDYSYLFYDYYTWLVKHGGKTTEELLSQGSKTMEALSDAAKSKQAFESFRSNIIGDVDDELTGLYEWATLTQEKLMADALGDSPLGLQYYSKGDDSSVNSTKGAKKDNRVVW